MHEKKIEEAQHVDRQLHASDSDVSTVVEDPVRLRRIRRKVDIRLSAILALMYCV